MRKNEIHVLVVIRLIFLAFILWATGCSHLSVQGESAPPAPEIVDSETNGKGWRSVRFLISRPDEEILWEIDLLIAHKIVGPVFYELQSEIDLWRFHRRAGNDDTGHQFSFIFYGSAVVAGKINERIQSNPLVGKLLRSGVLRNFFTANLDENDRPNIGDTSDPKWSMVMKDNWPHYIMGISRMWLGMIDQISFENDGLEQSSQTGLLAHYKEVNRQVTNIWQQEGYHALLHHLNAIYGYEAMVYWEKRWKAF